MITKINLIQIKIFVICGIKSLSIENQITGNKLFKRKIPK